MLLKKSRGFSLIETMAASGLLVTIVFATITMTSNQQKKNLALNQKLEALELERTLTNFVNDDASCSCMLGNISLANQTANGIPITIRGGCSTNTFLLSNSPVPGSRSGLRISTILLKNLVDVGGNNRIATLEISFDQATLTESMKPLSIQQALTTNGTSLITGCMPQTDPGRVDLQIVCSGIVGAVLDPVLNKCVLPTSNPQAVGLPTDPTYVRPGTRCSGTNWYPVTSAGFQQGFVMYTDSAPRERKCCGPNFPTYPSELNQTMTLSFDCHPF